MDVNTTSTNKHTTHTTYAPTTTHQPTPTATNTTTNAYNLTVPASGTVTPTTDGSSGSGGGEVTPYIFSSTTSNNITGNLINTATHTHAHTNNTTTHNTTANKSTNKKSQSHPKLTKAGLLTNNTLLPILHTSQNPPKINIKAENKRPPTGEPPRKYTKRIRVPEPVFTSLSGFGHDITGGEGSSGGEGEGEYTRTSSTLTTSSCIYINDNNTNNNESIFNCFNTTLSEKGHNYDPLTGTSNNNHTGNDNGSIYNDLSLNDVSSLLLSMRSSASGRAYSNTALVNPTMYIHDIQQAIEAKEGHREC